MTPVEERIDHEYARALAQSLHQATWNGAEEPTGPGISDSYRLWVGYGKQVARAYLALLTEHSAREEELQRALEALVDVQPYLHPNKLKGLKWEHRRQTALDLAAVALNTSKTALPATESAQPEQAKDEL